MRLIPRKKSGTVGIQTANNKLIIELLQRFSEENCIFLSLLSYPCTFFVATALPANCTHGDVTVNSESNKDKLEGVAGRLEVCFNNVWFVICSGYTWHHHVSVVRQKNRYTNERVVCQMLGYAASGTDI